MSRYLAVCLTVDLGAEDPAVVVAGLRVAAHALTLPGGGGLVDGHWTADSATIADALGVDYDRVEVAEVLP